MILRSLLVATVAAVAVVPAADAAMCIRLSTDAPTPVVGEATTIQMRTYVPYPEGLRPWIVADYPFVVEAVSPRGKVFRVAVKPSSNPYAWRGFFRFRGTGVWTVRVRNWGPTYQKGCGERLRVRVRVRA